MSPGELVCAFTYLTILLTLGDLAVESGGAPELVALRGKAEHREAARTHRPPRVIAPSLGCAGRVRLARAGVISTMWLRGGCLTFAPGPFPIGFR